MIERKEIVVVVGGYALPVRVSGEKVSYCKETLKGWCLDTAIWGYNLEATEVEVLFAEYNDWLEVINVKDVMKKCLDKEDYLANLDWFRSEAHPQIIRIAQKASSGCKIVKLNGLYVRQHPEHPELYSLNDCHKSANNLLGGKWEGKAVKWWFRLPTTLRLKKEVQSGVRKSHLTFITQGSGDYATRGTWACRELLYAYTEYLHPKLHLQILSVFAKSENVVERPPKVTSNGVVQDEGWKEHRAASKAEFSAFNAVNKRHGLSPPSLTNRIYEGMYGTNKDGVARMFSVPNDPLRDFLPIEEMGKHTTAMELVRQDIARGSVSSDNKQESYIHATAAGKFTAQMFSAYSAMTLADKVALIEKE